MKYAINWLQREVQINDISIVCITVDIKSRYK